MYRGIASCVLNIGITLRRGPVSRPGRFPSGKQNAGWVTEAVMTVRKKEKSVVLAGN
jgi:hypothetical protein